MEIQIGRRIRELREAKGLSQAALAQELGVSPVTVYRWESGAREISLTMLGQVADVLEAEPLEFFPKSEPPLPFSEVAEERGQAAEELAHDWVEEVAGLRQRSEYRLQQRLDTATTKKEREHAGLEFYEDWQSAYVLIDKAIDRGQATEVPELKAALDEWCARTLEFHSSPEQRAKQDERLKGLDTRTPVEGERSARD